MPEVKDPNILAQLNGQQPQVQQASPPPFIPGTPKPPAQPSPQTPAQAQGDVLDNQYRQMQIDEMQRKQAEEAQKQQNLDSGIKDSIYQMRNVIDAAQKAKKLSQEGWFATGFGASTARGMDGTTAADVKALLNTIGSNTAFDRLQKMRDQSPTGGALGAVSEIELQLLRDSIASIDQTQSDAQFQENMDKIIASYQRVIDRIEGKAQTPQGGGDATATQPRRDPNAPPGFFWSNYDEGGNPTGGIYDENGQPLGPDGGGGYDEQGNYLGLFFRVTDEAKTPAESATSGWNEFGKGTRALINGAMALPELAINPVGDALYSAMGNMTGDPYYNQPYDAGQIISDALGLPQGDPNSLAWKVNEFGGSALTGGLAARGIAATINPGTAQAVAQTLGRTPLRDTAAGIGAGAGSYAGQQSGIPGGEIAGSIAGGLAGYGAANAGMNALAPRQMSNVAAAAQRQGVDLLPADTGGRVTQMVTSGAKVSPLSAGPVVAQAQRNVGQLAEATKRVAGDVPTTDVAGMNVRNAATRYSQETRDRFGRLYDKAHDAAQGVRIKPLQTVQAIDERIARLKNDPSAPEGSIAELERFRDRIAGGVNVQGLRDARTRLSEGIYDGKLRSNVDQAAWKEILGNLSSDIELGLKNAGRNEAASMFKRADEGWKARVEHLDEVLQPILGTNGQKSGEDIIKALETMTRGGAGGNARLSRLLGNMAPEESAQVRGIIIDRLGRANPGAQNAAGDVFSPATFLTNWNKMTPQAKASLFSNTKQRNDLNDLAVIAEGMKGTRSMENFSNTATSTLSNVGIGAAAFYADPTLALLGAGGQYLTGRLMASPKFARILASTAKLPPEQQGRRLTEQLGILAKNDAVLEGDINRLLEAVNSGQQENNGR